MDQDSLGKAVVKALLSAGIDVLTSSESGGERLSDVGQLEYATAEGRAIYTANRRASAARSSPPPSPAFSNIWKHGSNREPEIPEPRIITAAHAFGRTFAVSNHSPSP
jgi:hypothetical protein